MNREETQQLAEIYSAHARGYADSWGPVIRPMGQRLLQALPWDGVRRVVDLGTGAGVHVPDIRRLARGACIDVIVMAFVLFHLDDPVVALREVRRVLRPGGAVGTVT